MIANIITRPNRTGVETGKTEARTRQADQQTGEEMASKQSDKECKRYDGKNPSNSKRTDARRKGILKKPQSQEKAEEKLNKEQFNEAVSEQEKALEELQKALDAMSKQEQEDKKETEQEATDNKDKTGADKTPEEKQAPERESEENRGDSQPGKQDDSRETPETENLNEDARDIIEREKQNRALRMLENQIKFKPVERDW